MHLFDRLRRRLAGAGRPAARGPEAAALPPGGTHSSRRINALARGIGAQRYLEIGVQSGATFFAVDIAEKVAVDPAFAFDPAAMAGPGLSFHPVPSDDYFAAAGDAQFDLVFIDGLHTFAQVEQDFRNTLQHVGPGAVILLDDTLPSDEYSAEAATGEEAVARRQAAGRFGDLSWHGDVYKLVFALHDLWPGFEYCGIADHGNPQTLCWQTPAAKPRQPRWGSLAAIDRLGWAELQANLDLLRLLPEREAIERCLAGLRGA